MRKTLVLLLFTVLYLGANAQKLESIQFNLYTDSLKKGFFNYINVEGKFSDGHWEPLDSSTLRFSANTGFFKGNDLFIDSSYQKDSVVVTTQLKSNPAIFKKATIYIRKRGFDEPLQTTDEILNDMDRKRRKGRDRSA